MQMKIEQGKKAKYGKIQLKLGGAVKELKA